MKIGYSMYSARDLVKGPEDMKNTLKALAEMGYEGVEFFLYAGVEPEQLKEMLEEFHLEAIATHVHQFRWDADTDAEIAYAAKAGIRRLVYPWVAPENRSEEFFRELKDYLEELSGKCSTRGIELLYHNHDFEFAPMGEGRVIDFLLGHSAAYGFELDTFWSEFAGVNAPNYLQQLGSRVPAIHIKDYWGVNETGNPQITAIGTGKLDNIPIIQTAREMDKEWLIVELDSSPYPVLDSAKMSIDYIQAALEM